MKAATVGKALITANALGQMIGPCLFDFNKLTSTTSPGRLTRDFTTHRP